MTGAAERRPLAGLLWLGGGALAGAGLTVAAVLALFAVFGAQAEAAAAGPPGFVEETATAGIDQVYDGEFPFFVGGGVAVLDCDDDGLLDLYVAGGSTPAGLFRNDSVPGRLSFDPLPSPVTDLTSVTGAYPVDVDGDRVVDLAVLRLGENVMLRGLGDCGFERANETWSIDGGEDWTVGFSATWEAGQDWPTIAFGNYVARTDAGLQTSGECSDNYLFRPAAGGGYGPPMSLSPGWCTLSILFSDWDRSGRRDLRLTNDRHYYRDGEEQLWRVEAGEVPTLYGRDDGWERVQIWGMGIASHDLTGDGYPEVFLTSQGDNKLQTLTDLTGSPAYRDIALASGVTAHRPFAGDDILPSTAWHAEFQDVNNDMFIDLLVTKGNVDAVAGFAMDDPTNLLLGRPDGTFAEGAVEAGIVDFSTARGAALADLDGDGLLDLVVVNRRENVALWRNTGGPDVGSWLAVDLEQPGHNHRAVGAWVEVRVGEQVVTREVTVGGGHAGGQWAPIHFGLGDADRAEVRVQWPDGEVGPWIEVSAEQTVVIER